MLASTLETLGAGGLIGGYTGARLPETLVRRVLGLLVLAIGVRCAARCRVADEAQYAAGSLTVKLSSSLTVSCVSGLVLEQVEMASRHARWPATDQLGFNYNSTS
jgi:uncharacterized membrane protein YfcA